MWQSGDIIMERLQARVGQPQSGTDEQVALRLKLGQLLGGADLYPAAMPPSAILMVQKLEDPLPGRILPDPGAVRVDPEWERAVRGALADLWRRAARPGPDGSVAADADAIAFADPAELLACVAVSLAQGGGVQWWFQALMSESDRSGGRPLTPAAVLGADPRFLPALLARLAAWGQAERVLEAIWPNEAMALLAGLARTFGLPESQIYLSLSGTAATVPAVEPQALQRLLPLVARLWRAAALSPERRALLGLALALDRQPALVRAEGGLAAVLRLWLEAEAVGTVVSQAAAGLVTEVDESEGLSLEELEALGVVRPTAENGPKWDEMPKEPAPKPRPKPTEGERPPAPKAATGGPGTTPDTPPAPTEPKPKAEAGAEAAPGIRTGLAGLFYLINLPVPPAPEGVSPWACLEVLGRGLLTEEQADLLADPVWAALAELDGREPGDPPGPAGDPDLAGWLEQVLPAVQARLMDLLQLEQPADLPDLLLRAPAWLCITRSHIDILMDLEAIALPVRLAGLDANPGWLPEYGRVIQFHFR